MRPNDKEALIRYWEAWYNDPNKGEQRRNERDAKKSKKKPAEKKAAAQKPAAPKPAPKEKPPSPKQKKPPPKKKPAAKKKPPAEKKPDPKTPKKKPPPERKPTKAEIAALIKQHEESEQRFRDAAEKKREEEERNREPYDWNVDFWERLGIVRALWYDSSMKKLVDANPLNVSPDAMQAYHTITIEQVNDRIASLGLSVDGYRPKRKPGPIKYVTELGVARATWYAEFLAQHNLDSKARVIQIPTIAEIDEIMAIEAKNGAEWEKLKKLREQPDKWKEERDMKDKIRRAEWQWGRNQMSKREAEDRGAEEKKSDPKPPRTPKKKTPDPKTPPQKRKRKLPKTPQQKRTEEDINRLKRNLTLSREALKKKQKAFTQFREQKKDDFGNDAEFDNKPDADFENSVPDVPDFQTQQKRTGGEYKDYYVIIKEVQKNNNTLTQEERRWLEFPNNLQKLQIIIAGIKNQKINSDELSGYEREIQGIIRKLNVKVPKKKKRPRSPEPSPKQAKKKPPPDDRTPYYFYTEVTDILKHDIRAGQLTSFIINSLQNLGKALVDEIRMRFPNLDFQKVYGITEEIENVIDYNMPRLVQLFIFGKVSKFIIWNL